MNMQIGTICDAAFDYGGKLCMVGAFDELVTDELPAIKATCSYVFQIRWVRGECGVHEIMVAFINERGEKTLDSMSTTLSIEIPPEKGVLLTNHIINFQQLKFKAVGNYYANLSADSRKLGHVQLCVGCGEKGGG
ncbi:MAG: hypothetical protein GF401_18760 [Chitinivibrionales bacterium]|nr:hypothetical protein [Chitinivibrionales bacterium]